ncbi:type II secretion system minor pseudopilin GspK [Sideroxydans lithotrophicus]|uniref:Type II secretion system protein K n=1 Tax=Sideroxydans lithotrophicus (strain ES-1) TaxID=580332 RepID=D5CMB8_SIDLE|nr:type II secretion system minor pseudopilin GspK [Sideroxydans lithotrophicus]ADE10732.1 General secretion pathway protein K [Sideroxydans lithotrophicus ES-1]
MKIRTQQGVALVLVLLIVAMATTIAAFMAQQQGFWQRAVENGRDRAQARRIAEAGIDWARAVLADDAAANQFDHGHEMWAMKLPAIPVEGGEVQGTIVDQQGVFNLNNLVNNGVTSVASLARFQRLLSALGLPQELGSALADWMDADSETAENGAEDGYYLSLAKPYRCANRPLSDIGELAWVKGFDAGIIKRLQPFVSVLPESNTAVNVNFAPPEVLVAILPGLTLQNARQMATKIRTTPYKTMADFLQQLPKSVSQDSTMSLSVSSQYFMVTGYATQGDGASSVHALLHRSGIWATQVRKSLQ